MAAEFEHRLAAQLAFGGKRVKLEEGEADTQTTLDGKEAAPKRAKLSKKDAELERMKNRIEDFEKLSKMDGIDDFDAAGIVAQE